MATPALTTTGVDHVVLYVADPERSMRFYTEVLGMTVRHGGGDHVFLACGGQLVGLFRAHGAAPPGRGTDLNHLALNVTEGTRAEIRAALESHGVKVWGRAGDPDCLYFEDPDGHHLQIVVPG